MENIVTGDVRAPDVEIPWGWRSRVRAELGDGETIVWVGQPTPWRAFYRALPGVLWGLKWLVLMAASAAAAGAWLAARLGPNPPIQPVILWGLVISVLLLPLGMIGGVLAVRPAWVLGFALQCLYVLTDRRAIVWWVSFRRRDVRSYTPKTLQNMQCEATPNGYGSLVFEETAPTKDEPIRVFVSWTPKRYGFLELPRVREVEELVRNTLLVEYEPQPCIGEQGP